MTYLRLPANEIASCIPFHAWPYHTMAGNEGMSKEPIAIWVVYHNPEYVKHNSHFHLSAKFVRRNVALLLSVIWALVKTSFLLIEFIYFFCEMEN